jgi:tellurite resistance protein TerA
MAINLNKITLEKQGDSHKIDLTKQGENSSKEIIINLNWTQETVKKGFWANLLGGNSSVDLDLGCFYELNNANKMVIDGLQFSQGQGGARNVATKQGRYTGTPWIWHTGDDRSGAGNGENILVNPQGLSDLKRIIVYCFIYEGVAKWAETNAVVTIKVPENPDIIVEMGKQYSSQKFCAIAEILFDNTNSMTVRKLVTFHNGHADCDKAYHWGLQWHAGSK